MNSICKLLAVLVLALLAACGPRVSPEGIPPVGVPPGFPEADYRQAAAEGAEVLHVDPARSLLTVRVGRAGALARLGHEHVVASHSLRGYVAPGRERADLYVVLDELSVDEPELRIRAGLETPLSPEAVQGTRRNMLDKVLESGRFPFALIHVTGAARDGAVLAVAITLHGTTRSFEVPVKVEKLADGLAVSGRLAQRQSAFGITPFAVFGGALQVRDELDMEFTIVARTAK